MPSANDPKTSFKSFKFMLSNSTIIPKHRIIEKHYTHEWCDAWTNCNSRKSSTKMRHEWCNAWTNYNNWESSAKMGHEWCNTWMKCNSWKSSAKMKETKGKRLIEKIEQLGLLGWYRCDVYVISSHIVYDTCF